MQRVVRRVASIGPAWIGVVVGSGAASVRAALADRRVRVVHARHWRDGMAASLVAGVRAAPRAARHLAILSVDQWRLETADFGRLCRAAGRLPAAAVYAGRRGVPAIFPARLRPALLALRGDRGARALLHGERVREVPMRGACDDLDTPADLQRLRAQRVRR